MLALVLAVVVSAEAPSPEVAPAAVDPLASWNTERLDTNRGGMWVLGGWAVANLAVGGIGAATTSDPRVQFFHLGNAVWNVVNLGLAVMGVINHWKAGDGPLDATEALKGSQTLEKVFFLNAGLDVAYLATAAFLWQRGDATGDARLVGLGQALLVQGGFLLAFDTTMALLNLRLSNRLFDRLHISPVGVSGTF